MSGAADIFAHHLEVFGNGDMDGILSDYSEDSVMMYGDKQFTGLAGAREFFNLWLNDWIPAGSRFDLIDMQTSDDMVYHLDRRVGKLRFRFRDRYVHYEKR